MPYNITEGNTHPFISFHKPTTIFFNFGAMFHLTGCEHPGFFGHFPTCPAAWIIFLTSPLSHSQYCCSHLLFNEPIQLIWK